ncbi:hypothetical protein OG497_00100 [Streptomyces sp. NBC_01242]|uniref:hypothetical protein n=1 Tax=Streptomyces sp. NBC_01242 TaxID=2903795 RepID=UPI00225BF7A9|nr:hypothetical protein [Streptomyces sp. NBC_01242]MCX4792670.1 hypothetical protein [Streptomyces sp. NBC_01242]
MELNHTIVPARDPQASAQFLAEILGLSVEPPVAHFTPVTLANQVSLDYDQLDDFEPHHYAFMVSEQEFDAALARIQHGGITRYGDPACQEIGQIYHSKRTKGPNCCGRRSCPVDPEADIVLRMQAQHERVEATLTTLDAAVPAWAASAGADERDTLADHRAVLLEYLDDEEATLLPLAAEYITEK